MIESFELSFLALGRAPGSLGTLAYFSPGVSPAGLFGEFGLGVQGPAGIISGRGTSFGQGLAQISCLKSSKLLLTAGQFWHWKSARYSP